MSVNFNNVDYLKDLYFPSICRDQNTNGHPGRVGFWVARQFRWLHEDSGSGRWLTSRFKGTVFVMMPESWLPTAHVQK
jgi:hypothetical protein